MQELRLGRKKRLCGVGICCAFVCLSGMSCPDRGNDLPKPDDPTWQLVLSELGGGLLSVSGTAANDVYAVGADAGDGGGPLVLHYDGERWTRLNSGASGDLWWISDAPIDGAFYMAGEGGLILRYTPATGQFERFTTPGTETLFGIWGTSASNVIAVGGRVAQPDTSGVIWNFNGSAWSAQDTSAVNAAGIPVLYKVWGRGAGEVYAVGARGTILLFNGTAWTQATSPTTRTLFTVHGNSSLVAAVGGAQSGVIVESADAGFANATPAGILQMNGVFVPGSGEAVAVGREGAVAFRTDGAWVSQDTGLDLDLLLDYHAAWVDPDGGVWAVGGNIVGEPRSDGILVYYGLAVVSSELN